MINPSLVRGLSIFSAGADSDPLSRRLRAMNRRPKRSMVRPERGRNRTKESLTPKEELDYAELCCFGEAVNYESSPLHLSFRAARDRGTLAIPSPSRTSCSEQGNIRCADDALALLRRSIACGMISKNRSNGGWPKNVWAVDDKQFVYEAALTNPETGLYHGYPLPDTKHTGFRNHVRDEWNRRATRRIK